MRRRLAFSFVVLGITSLIAQVLLIRELLISLHGNELFVGWTLFAWLFWVGIGSFAAGRAMREPRRPAVVLMATQVLSALLVPASIILVRWSRVLISSIPGQVPDILPSLACAFFALAPLCLMLGIQFVAGAKTLEAARNAPSLGMIIGRAYIQETLGFVAGGMLFGYLLITLNEFRTAALVAWLGILAAAWLHTIPGNRSFTRRLILITASALTTVVFSPRTPSASLPPASASPASSWSKRATRSTGTSPSPAFRTSTTSSRTACSPRPTTRRWEARPSRIWPCSPIRTRSVFC